MSGEGGSLPSADETEKRRRRRPQLSCVLCRQRKVKCNRELPCDQCYKLSKGRSCVYFDILLPLAKSDQNVPVSLNLGDTVNRATPYRTPAESDAEEYLWTENRASLGNNSQSQQQESGFPEIRQPGSNTARSPLSPIQQGGPAESRNETACSASSTPPAPPRCIVQVNESADSHLAFLGDNWCSEHHGNSHWWIVFPKLTSAMPLISLISSMGVDTGNGMQLPFWKYLTDLREKKMMHFNLHAADAALVSHPDVRDGLKSREQADVLVQKYFQSLGQIYGGTSVASFMDSYESLWRNESQPCEFAVGLGLIFAIGNAFLANEDPNKLPFSAIAKWIGLAKVWRNSALEVTKYGLSHLQVDILLQLSKRLHSYGQPTDSVDCAMLVRNAVAMRLHKENLHVSILPEERLLRRRLWHTVIELDLQSSLESGMPPTFSDSWDMERCQAMIQDDVMLAGLSGLLRSLPIRLKIANFLNGSDYDLSYDMAYELHSSLMATVGWLFSDDGAERHRCGNFLLDYQKLVINRTLLALHWPFAIQGNLRYYFSRNICLVTAMRILQQALVSPSERRMADNHLHEMARGQSSIFQNDLLPAALYLCFELNRVLSAPDVGNPLGQISSLQLEAKGLLDTFLALAEKRVVGSEYSEMPFVLISVLRRYIRWQEEANAHTYHSTDDVLQTVVRDVGQRCLELTAQRSQFLGC